MLFSRAAERNYHHLQLLADKAEKWVTLMKLSFPFSYTACNPEILWVPAKNKCSGTLSVKETIWHPDCMWIQDIPFPLNLYLQNLQGQFWETVALLLQFSIYTSMSHCVLTSNKTNCSKDVVTRPEPLPFKFKLP